jgi:hypothetical protein
MADDSSVAGGAGNRAEGIQSSIAGGEENVTSGFRSSVGGGQNRSAPNDYNWAAGSLLEPN